MKYKLIKGLIYNFTDSFMSLMNYIHDDYTVDTLREFIWTLPDRTFSVTWFPAFSQSITPVPTRVEASLAHYCEWLPKLAAKVKVDLTHVAEIRTTFHYTSRIAFEAITTAVDDRGKEYTIKKK